jgi:hypothetical protein
MKSQEEMNLMGINRILNFARCKGSFAGFYKDNKKNNVLAREIKFFRSEMSGWLLRDKQEHQIVPKNGTTLIAN